MAAASLIHRRTTDADTAGTNPGTGTHNPTGHPGSVRLYKSNTSQPLPMTASQVTLTNTNGQSVTIAGEHEAIANILTALNYTQPEQTAAPVINTTEQKALKYIDFLSVELDKYIKGGKFFVSELNRLRLQGNGYIPMNHVYRDLVNKKAAGWAKRRQLLLTASAIWRYTFAGQPELRGDILAAAECTDCGEFATAMIERMKEEKLWV